MMPRPAEVTRACQILWVVMLASILSLHPALRGEWWVVPESEGAEAIGSAALIGVTALSGIIYGVVLWLTGRGHNWARWALLVFVVVSTVFAAGEFPRSLSETPAAAVMDVFFTVAELWAFRLLFFGPAAQWYRRT
jgi:hypothetical protein